MLPEAWSAKGCVLENSVSIAASYGYKIYEATGPSVAFTYRDTMGTNKKTGASESAKKLSWGTAVCKCIVNRCVSFTKCRFARKTRLMMIAASSSLQSPRVSLQCPPSQRTPPSHASDMKTCRDKSPRDDRASNRRARCAWTWSWLALRCI